jgi:purine-binding chemotaxis protein CheW
MAFISADQSLEVLTYGLQGEIFAIDASIVHEILDMVPITEVPSAQAYVCGLINVRGRVVPLADLRLKFGMDAPPPTRDTRIVVIEVDFQGDQTMVGILADKVYGVEQIEGASIEDTPRVGLKWRQDFIRGIGKRADDFVIILDIDHIFSTKGQLHAMDENRPSAESAH